MNDLQRSIWQIGQPAEATVPRIIERKTPLMTEGQIETAGRAYVHATVWAALGHALVDGMRLVGRTLWTLSTIAAIGFAAAWVFKHWPAIIRWL